MKRLCICGHDPYHHWGSAGTKEGCINFMGMPECKCIKYEESFESMIREVTEKDE